MRRGSHLLSCWVLAMDSAAHKDNKDELPVALKSYAELVFSVPHETALVEFIFSIMDVVQAGRRTSNNASRRSKAWHTASTITDHIRHTTDPSHHRR